MLNLKLKKKEMYEIIKVQIHWVNVLLSRVSAIRLRVIAGWRGVNFARWNPFRTRIHSFSIHTAYRYSSISVR